MKFNKNFILPKIPAGDKLPLILSAVVQQEYPGATTKARLVVGENSPMWEISVNSPAPSIELQAYVPDGHSVGQVIDEVLYRCNVLANWKKLKGQRFTWDELSRFVTVVCSSASRGVVYDAIVAVSGENYNITLTGFDPTFGNVRLETTISAASDPAVVIAHASQLAKRLSDEPC